MRKVGVAWLTQAGWLSAVVLGVWLAALGPALLWAGPAALEGLIWAAALCLVPGWLVIFVVSKAEARRRDVLGMLLGTGLRLVAVSIGAIAVALWRPNLRVKEFFLWLAVFYVVALAVETRLLYAGQRSPVKNREPEELRAGGSR